MLELPPCRVLGSKVWRERPVTPNVSMPFWSSLLKSNQYPLETTAISLRKSRAQSLWLSLAAARGYVRERARACALARRRTRARVHERAQLRSSRIAGRTKSRRINVTGGLKAPRGETRIIPQPIHRTRVNAADPFWLVALHDTDLRNSIFFFKQMSG